MIELYSGTPGSGKSLHVVGEIRSRLRMRKKNVIIGNFFVDTKAIKRCRGRYIYVRNYRLTPERLLLFSRRYSQHLGRRLREGELLLIIDEAELLFNSRDWQNIARQGWLSFFSQHRHYGYDIILIAQFDRMLDRQVRCQIEYNVIHRKVSRAGFIGFILGLFSGKKLFVAVTNWYPIREKVYSSFFLGKKSMINIYDSYNHFDAPGQAGRGHSSLAMNAALGGKVSGNRKGENNIGLKGLDILRDRKWNSEGSSQTAGDIPGSLPAVVPDETEDDKGTEL